MGKIKLLVNLIMLKKFLSVFVQWQCKISCVNTKRDNSVIVELRNITRKRFIPKYMKIMESLGNTDNLLFFCFPTRFGTAFIRQTSLSLLPKKSNVKRKRRFFSLTRRLWNLIQLPCLKIIISSKVNKSIKGLANVLTHLKAYLINTP